MKKIVVYFIISFFFFSCQKDDPFSKEDLIVNSWMLDETTKDGSVFIHENLYYSGSIYTFYDDQSLEFKIAQSKDNIYGTWQLDEQLDKLNIFLPNIISEFDIVKLNDSTLWLSSYSAGSTYIYKYKISEVIY